MIHDYHNRVQFKIGIRLKQCLKILISNNDKFEIERWQSKQYEIALNNGYISIQIIQKVVQCINEHYVLFKKMITNRFNIQYMNTIDKDDHKQKIYLHTLMYQCKVFIPDYIQQQHNLSNDTTDKKTHEIFQAKITYLKHKHEIKRYQRLSKSYDSSNQYSNDIITDRERYDIDQSIIRSAGIILNMVISSVVTYIVIHYIFSKSFSRYDMSLIAGTIGATIMLIIQTVLFIIYMSHIDHEAAKLDRYKERKKIEMIKRIYKEQRQYKHKDQMNKTITTPNIVDHTEQIIDHLNDNSWNKTEPLLDDTIHEDQINHNQLEKDTKYIMKKNQDLLDSITESYIR